MNKEQLLARLAYFLDNRNGIGAALYFIMTENGEPLIRFADIEDVAKNELKERFLEYIREKFIDDADLHYLKLSDADERKNVVYRYDIEERPQGLSMMNDIIANGEREHFRFNEHHLSDVKGYLITIGNEGNQIALYKKQHPINLLNQDRFLLIPNNQRLVKLNQEALAIDRSFDFMMIDENLLILKLNILERFFGFEDIIRNQAQNAIAAVEANDLLEDIEQLHELALNMGNARKLMKIRSSPVLNVPVINVINFIRNHPELTGRIGFNADETKINLTTGVSKKLFLKLLNDDYLFSQLTELQYATYAKDAIEN